VQPQRCVRDQQTVDEGMYDTANCIDSSEQLAESDCTSQKAVDMGYEPDGPYSPPYAS
jgi:hypothetical protein